MRRTPTTVLLAAGLAASIAAPAPGQVFEWQAIGSGQWSNPANWNPIGVPNGTAADAVLGQMIPYVVSDTPANFVVNSLTISNPNATLALTPGRLGSVRGGGIFNDGLIRLNQNNTIAGTLFRFDQTAAIDGAGVFRLEGAGTRARITRFGSAIITHGADHTIEGFGQISSGLVNNGLVNANAPGANLAIDTASWTNNGEIRASNDGLLTASAITITQAPAGLIHADNGDIDLVSTSITGGLLTTSNGGTIEASGNATLDGVTITDTFFITPGALQRVRNGLTVNGLLEVNRSNVAAATNLRFDNNSLITGGGTVRLEGVGSRAQITRFGSPVITLDAGTEIQGFGQILSGLTNNGAVRANVDGATLLLSAANWTNNGLLTAESGGALTVSAIAITQGPAGVIDNQSTLTLSGATVNGGAIQSAPTREALFTGTNTVDAVAIAGDAHVAPGGLLVVRNDLTHSGQLDINRNNTPAATNLRFDTTSVMTGGGTVRLEGDGSRAQITRFGSPAITNAADHTIAGFGQITAGLINNGLISADRPAATLALNAADITNNATIRAVNGAELLVSGITIDQTGGGAITAQGSTLTFTGATVDGGTVQADASSNVAFNGTCTIDDLFLDADALLPPGSLLAVREALTHTGVLTVNGDDTAAATNIRFDTIAVMTGGGTVRLVGSDARAQITRFGGVTVTNAADHTIAGFGQITSGLINNGLVTADRVGRNLDLIAANITNNAELRAENSSALNIAGITVNQAGGGAINLDGATLNLSGATLIGGSINDTTPAPRGGGGPAPSLVSVTGSVGLEAVTLNADTETAAGSTLILRDALVNNADIAVNPANVAAATAVRVDTNLVFTGSGRLVLAGENVRAQLTRSGGVSVTNGPGHTIAGHGRIATPLTNGGRIEPGLDGPGAMDATQPITMTDTSAYKVEIAGLNPGEFDVLASSAAIALDGVIEVDFVDGFTPSAPGVITVMSSSSGGITGTFDAAIGDAPSAPLVLRVARTNSVVEIGFTCIADLAVPLTTLDIADVVAFLNAFQAQDPVADLAPPAGQFDIADVIAYLQTFGAECPK